MSLLSRIVCIVLCALSVIGCTYTGEFRPLEFKEAVVQEALPGRALVYLIRAPHDTATVLVERAGRRVAELPPETHTAFSTVPGELDFGTFTIGTIGSRTAIAPPVQVRLVAGQRLFLVLTGSQERQTRVSGVLPGATPLPIFVPSLATSERAWKEFNEVDARGLIGVTRVVLPERSAESQ
jgi:hypothetical protein